MRTREEAERKAGELNSETAFKLLSQGQFYSIDQSPSTGAWRVIENRQGYFQKVVSS